MKSVATLNRCLATWRTGCTGPVAIKHEYCKNQAPTRSCQNPVITMSMHQGINRVDKLDVDAVRREAEQAGYTVFVLPGSAIVDGASFFDSIRATFPLDPPLTRYKSWDALSDSLWEGLYRHPARRIAVLWPGAALMARSAPVEFETALGVWAQISKQLADPQATCDNPKEVSVLVE
jgi:hypothetical protein